MTAEQKSRYEEEVMRTVRAEEPKTTISRGGGRGGSQLQRRGEGRGSRFERRSLTRHSAATPGERGKRTRSMMSKH